MKNELTLGSLFDGSGGFPLGGLLAGIKPLWASEIERRYRSDSAACCGGRSAVYRAD